MNLTNISQFLNTTSEMMRDNLTLYNTGCIEEISKATSLCTKFRLHVFDTMEHKFIISLIIMSALMLFMILIKYRPYKFKETKFWKEKIEYRIDLVIIIMIVFNLLYIFMM